MARRTKPVLPPPAAPQLPLPLDDDPLFFQYVIANQGLGLDPLSPEALRLQAKFVLEVGTHPMDVLRHVMQNVFTEPGHRISAAKALLEYGARKVPAQFELTGKDGAALTSLPAEALKKLSKPELDAFQQLCAKMQEPA